MKFHCFSGLCLLVISATAIGCGIIQSPSHGNSELEPLFNRFDLTWIEMDVPVRVDLLESFSPTNEPMTSHKLSKYNLWSFQNSGILDKEAIVYSGFLQPCHDETLMVGGWASEDFGAHWIGLISGSNCWQIVKLGHSYVAMDTRPGGGIPSVVWFETPDSAGRPMTSVVVGRGTFGHGKGWFDGMRKTSDGEWKPASFDVRNDGSEWKMVRRTAYWHGIEIEVFPTSVSFSGDQVLAGADCRFGYHRCPGLLRSDDGGSSWTLAGIAVGTLSDPAVDSVLLHSWDGRAFAFISGELFLSSDAGRTWNHVGLVHLHDDSDKSVRPEPRMPSKLYFKDEMLWMVFNLNGSNWDCLDCLDLVRNEMVGSGLDALKVGHLVDFPDWPAAWEHCAAHFFCGDFLYESFPDAVRHKYAEAAEEDGSHRGP